MKWILFLGNCLAVFVWLATSGCVSKKSVPVAAETPPAQMASSPSIPTNAFPPSETNLFNGKDLTGWEETNFGAHGPSEVTNGEIIINMGDQLSGIRWTNAAALPKTDYEIELDTKKLDGNDFFCGLTIPVGNSFCTFVVGGWGGSVVGISSIDGGDASENDTSKGLFFEKNHWYHIRVRVTPEKIMAWIDQDKVVDVGIKGRKVAMRTGEIEESIPMGIATWQTTAAVKNIKLKTF